MKKPKSRARRVYDGPSKSDPQRERQSAATFLESLTPRQILATSPPATDQATMVELIGVAGRGVRLLLDAEACLKELPALMSSAQLEALDRVETCILISQTLFKEIAGAARYSLAPDFEIAPQDENAFDEINEDEQKYSIAEMKNSGI